MVPRSYQLEAFEKVKSLALRGTRRVIVEAPTGAGKTFLASMFIRAAMDKGRRSLFLAPRQELIYQASRHLQEFGVPHGIIMAGEPYHPHASVQVASKDTLASRTLRSQAIAMPQADLIVPDECDLSTAPEWLKLLRALDNGENFTLGLTATPSRKSGAGLGVYYEAIVKMDTYKNLQKRGHLVPPVVYAPTTVDLKGVKETNLDWDSGELDMRCTKTLVGDVIEHWKMLAPERKTVVFGAGIGHSKALRDRFYDAGIRVAHIDQNTPKGERKDLIGQLAKGNLQVICNCDVLTRGWDDPTVSCVILAAPTRSIVRYRQRAGRAFRPSQGKTECLIIDHSGAVYLHGFPDDDKEWGLNCKELTSAERKKEQREHASSMRQCPECYAVFYNAPECPVCGWHKVAKGLDIAVKKGLLKRVRPKRAWPKNDPKYDQMVWCKCIGIAMSRNAKVGMAVAIFKERTGRLPWEANVAPLPSGAEWKQQARDVFRGFGNQRRLT